MGLSLLFPLGHILISWTFQKHWGGSKCGRAAHVAEAFSPRTLLTLTDGHAQHTQNQPTHHAAGHQGPADKFWETTASVKNSSKLVLGHLEPVSSREHSPQGCIVSPKSSQLAGQLQAPSAQFTVSQLLMGTLRLPHFQPGIRQGGGRRRIRTSKNWIQMEKPIWPKVETSAVQHPKMRLLALASCCSPRIPNHTHPMSPKVATTSP